MKRLIVLGLTLSLVMGIVNVSFAAEKEEAKMKYLDEKKSPSTALLWSLFITGAGQIYNKETTKGLLMLAGEIVCVATMFEDKTTTVGNLTTTTTEAKTPQLIGALGIGIWSCVDAYKGANKFNEKLKQKYGVSLLLDEGRPTLGFKYNF